MATDIIQLTNVGNTTTSPTTATFPVSPKAGDLIVVGIQLFVAGSFTSISDSNGNTYIQAATTGFAQSVNLFLYYAVAIGGTGADVITVTTTGASRIEVFAAEYRGPWPAVIVDSTAKQNTSGSSLSYSLATSAVPDLIVSINGGNTLSFNFSGLSGTDRSGVTSVGFEYNDILQAPSGATTITATVQSTGLSGLSASFFTITEPALVPTYAIDDLLSIINDELHGKKNAFPESQKIRHTNKALDEIWKIMKQLHGGYWLTNNTPGLTLDTVNTDFILPADFAEVRLIEVTNPVDYVGIDVIQMPMTSGLFKNERQSFRALQTSASSDSVLAIPGQLNYDIYGPDNANKMHLLFSRPAPVPLNLLVWYIRMVGHFSIPKQPTEILQSLMSPYVWNLAVYAAKSLLKSESSDQGEFAKWEEQWSKEIDRAMPAAHERATADEMTVEGFVEI
jgi:hypothetical protein